MYHFYADDGRIMTPPKELEPQLRGAFPAFSKLLGHIRFFYMVDEIWDGKSSLVFRADGNQLAAFTLGNGAFDIHIADETFLIVNESSLGTVFEALMKTVSPSLRRPFEQLTVSWDGLGKFPCGYRCDMCLLNVKHNENDFSGSEKFGVLNWLCYHSCVPGVNVERNDCQKWVCPGCETSKKRENFNCRYFYCPTEKGYANCVECGDYHSCDVHRDGHYPGQCNLGLTADEVTGLVIPYCMKERFDIFRNSKI